MDEKLERRAREKGLILRIISSIKLKDTEIKISNSVALTCPHQRGALSLPLALSRLAEYTIVSQATILCSGELGSAENNIHNCARCRSSQQLDAALLFTCCKFNESH